MKTRIAVRSPLRLRVGLVVLGVHLVMLRGEDEWRDRKGDPTSLDVGGESPCQV